MYTESVKFKFKKDILTSQQLTCLQEFATSLEQASDEVCKSNNYGFFIDIDKQVVRIDIWWSEKG